MARLTSSYPKTHVEDEATLLVKLEYMYNIAVLGVVGGCGRELLPTDDWTDDAHNMLLWPGAQCTTGGPQDITS